MLGFVGVLMMSLDCGVSPMVRAERAPRVLALHSYHLRALSGRIRVPSWYPRSPLMCVLANWRTREGHHGLLFQPRYPMAVR